MLWYRGCGEGGDRNLRVRSWLHGAQSGPSQLRLCSGVFCGCYWGRWQWLGVLGEVKGQLWNINHSQDPRVLEYSWERTSLSSVRCSTSWSVASFQGHTRVICSGWLPSWEVSSGVQMLSYNVSSEEEWSPLIKSSPKKIVNLKVTKYSNTQSIWGFNSRITYMLLTKVHRSLYISWSLHFY